MPFFASARERAAAVIVLRVICTRRKFACEGKGNNPSIAASRRLSHSRSLWIAHRLRSIKAVFCKHTCATLCAGPFTDQGSKPALRRLTILGDAMR